MWEVFGHYLFKYYFYPFTCLISSWNTRCADTDMLDNVSQFCQALVILFPSHFRLFLREDNLNWYIVDF